MMYERCLMLRPRTQTSSLLAGQDAGTPYMTSCRVPLTPRGESSPSPCLCPSSTLTQEEEMKKTWRTVTAPLLRPSGRRLRGTAKLLHSPSGGQLNAASVTVNLLPQKGLVAGG